MSTVANGTEKLKKTILQILNQHWKDNGRALLLSQLGVSLGRDKKLDLTKTLCGRKLLQFIRNELGGELRVVEDPFNLGIWGLLPANADIEDDLRTYFERKKPGPYSGRTRGPRFDRRLWEAFSQPLDKNRFRLIELGSEVRYFDVDEESAESSKAFTIDVNRIVAPAEGFDPDRYKKIRTQIEEWASENKIDIFRLLQQPSKRDGRQRIPEGGAVSGDTALHALLGLIEPHDLRRISAPLDVIARLLRQEKPQDS